MRLKRVVLGTVFAVLFLSLAAGAHQIMLKDGSTYTGKFMGGDSTTVEFQILGRIERFKVTDVMNISFEDPVMEYFPGPPGVDYPEPGFSEGDFDEPVPPTMEKPTACTMDAKICPDGTAVGRTGPNCEFAPCPK